MVTQLKTVIVGKGHIGGAIAKRLAEKGHKVFCVDSVPGKADYTADATNAEELAGAMKAADEAMGGIDSLINCFGGSFAQPVTELDQALIVSALGVAVGGTVNSVNAALPYLKKNENGSRVLNISSVRGRIATGGHALEAAIAGAVSALSKEQAVDLSPSRVAVNSLAPWVIEENPGMTAEQLKKVVTMSLLDRPMNTSDIAEVAEFLISPAAMTINAFDLVLDGGMSIHRVRSEFSNFDSKGSDYYR